MKQKNIFKGLLFILAAFLIGAACFGLLGDISIFNIAVTAVCAVIFITSIKELNFAGMLFPLAIIGIIFDQQLGIEKLTPWPILIIAFLLTLGLESIFPSRKNKNFRNKSEAEYTSTDEDTVNIDTRFNGIVKYLDSKSLKYVNINSKFAGTKLFFDKAEIDGDVLEINVNMSFSGCDFYFPKNWRVEDNLNTQLAGIEVKGVRSDVFDKTVHLEGNMSFSGININYV